eukprot:CAMPEP_0119555984 /NCGR_PEP_ID=MMETSP1352-20130426/8051_1 /TAXON_ID=265584 /ORGANISM="Stauroneis constricta, Strain CCMP1120" /LENGTH=466 /DNA_ID=CAMNT_0007602861 /DNA_START=144 /DNA_END=1541 /DNA_ORIENTATION=+
MVNAIRSPSTRRIDFRRPGTKKKWIPLRLILIGLAAFLVCLYVIVFRALFVASNNQAGDAAAAAAAAAAINANSFHQQHELHSVKTVAGKSSNNDEQSDTKNDNRHEPKSYQDWKRIALDLAAKHPSDVLSILQNEDPFGVRAFERRLIEMESSKQRFLSLQEIQQELFPCNPSITIPDQRRMDVVPEFQDRTSTSTFLFFQHLRKAGGTNFCTLAQRNLPKEQVPKYYCMPDYHWRSPTHHHRACGGCYSYWNNTEMVTNMRAEGHKIMGNEWDAFEPQRFFELPAVFATSFRKPLHRALSQFRFECIEDRGCKIKEIEKWWQKRKDLHNVYVWTFTNQRLLQKQQASATSISTRQRLVGKAIDTIAKFHLVLVMEWLAYAPHHVHEILGFENTDALTERIRPHISQYKRNDGQEKNQLGAAGIAKASWTPENYLSKEQYKIMSEDLALDEILTDVARRMFLERI